MKFETRYNIGDRVYYPRVSQVTKQHPCPDCLDTRQWSARSPAGTSYTFICPRCRAHYPTELGASLNYTAFEVTVDLLTIGYIRVTQYDNEHGQVVATYLDVEGTGNTYTEDDLFPTPEEAQKAGDSMIAYRESLSPAPTNIFAGDLDLSDNQLTSVPMEAGRKLQVATELAAQQLIGDLAASKTLDEVFARLDDGLTGGEQQ